MRGNFVDVPTDCPQRDERLGWTGDIAAFAPTAAFLYDVDGFLGDWLRRPRPRAAAPRRHRRLRHPRRAEVPGPRPGELPRGRVDRRLERRRRSGCRGRSTRRTATSEVLAPPVRLDDRARAPRALAALAQRALGHRLPVRRLARPGRAAGGPGEGEGRHGRGRHRLRVPVGGDRRRDGRAARPARRSGRSSRQLAADLRAAFNGHYVRRRPGEERLHDRLLRSPSRSGSSTRRTRRSRATAWPSSPPRPATASPPDSRGRRSSRTR